MLAHLNCDKNSHLCVSDVDVAKPDEKSVMTYVAQFLKAYPEAGEDPSVSTNFLKSCLALMIIVI